MRGAWEDLEGADGGVSGPGFVKQGTFFAGMRKRPRGLAGAALVWNGLGLEEQPGGDLKLTRAVETVVGSGDGAEG